MADRNTSKAKTKRAAGLRELIQKKDAPAVSALVRKGVDVNAAWKNGYIEDETPLMLASDAGAIEIVEILLRSGADVALRTKSEAGGAGNLSALDYALNPAKKEVGYLRVVESLIKAGAPVDVPTNNGTTPLATASRSGWKEAVTLLLKAGAKAHTVSPSPSPPLHHAVLSDKADVVDLLLENGAPVDCRNESGDTALMIGLGGGKEEGVKPLLKRGANVNARNARNETTLILAALFASEAEYDDVPKAIRLVDLMLSHGVSLNEKDANGKTAFDYAKDAYDPEIVKFFKQKSIRSRSPVPPP